MEKIGLLIDSTTLTRTDISTKPYIKVVDLHVMIDGKDYFEGELSTEMIVKKIHETKKLSTSQPAPGVFLEKLEEFHQEGYTHVLIITLSAAISGTYQSALIAKSLVDYPMEIVVRSPKVASFGVCLGIPLLGEMIEKKKPFVDIVNRYEALYQDAAVMFTLADLMHLFRGGRLGIVSALLGSILRIKPIVEMINGKLVLVKKERTNLACLNFFMDKLKRYEETYKHVYVDVIHLNKPEWAEKLIEEIKTKYPKTEIHLTDYVSPVFFVHLGDQGFGIAIMGE
ncbi:MAG: DegV family protein [Candidatus Izemoplasmatales bacterium]|jgi:DegV family protein with EDD domain